MHVLFTIFATYLYFYRKFRPSAFNLLKNIHISEYRLLIVRTKMATHEDLLYKIWLSEQIERFEGN